MRRVRRVLSATATALAWTALGFLLAFLEDFRRVVAGPAVRGAVVSAWITWQGASREQRERMRREMRREDDRFDLWDNDLRSE